MTGLNDPKNYARVSKPYETRMDAETAMQAFLADVTKARQKHRIPEVVITCAVYAPEEEQNDKSQIRLLSSGRSLGNAVCWPQLISHLIRTTMMEYSNLLQSVRDAAERGDKPDSPNAPA